MFLRVATQYTFWMRAVEIKRSGGAEVLDLVELAPPVCSPSQVLVRNSWAGVNYIDVYQRSGAYKMDFPQTLGLEGAGEVVEVGSAVTLVAKGDRVAWGWAQGSYAELVAVEESKAVPIPDGTATSTAAASMMQCITAHYLATSVYEAKSGDTALVHAAAGGVGLILCQMLSAMGVAVIGTVSTFEKEALALKAGASHAIRYDQIDFTEAVTEITDGKKCNVVYDSVGATTFEGSLLCLQPLGTMALFGASSGPVPPFDLQRLAPLGSLRITRPTIAHFIRTREELLWRASEIFSQIEFGSLKLSIGGTYDLNQVRQAHLDIESRTTTGKLLLRI